MLSENKFALYFLCSAFLVAFSVVLLGAYTRLKDAGLGCPDWPACYGKFTLPNHTQQISHGPFIGKILNPKKAWPEMIHRYAAASLVILSFAAVVLIIYQHRLPQQPVKIAIILLFLLFFQGLLGKWTVTLQLNPLIVLLHLLGGLTLLSLLWILICRLSRLFLKRASSFDKTLKPWAAFGLLLIILQICLGGWTSANYAAFVCPDFPTCQNLWWPTMNFHEGFHLHWNTAINYEGGTLSHTARTAIQMSHRIMAILTALYLSLLIYKLFNVANNKFFRSIAFLLALLLMIQISLGILNVVWILPLPIAMAHNAIAALLLLTIITLNISLRELQR